MGDGAKSSELVCTQAQVPVLPRLGTQVFAGVTGLTGRGAAVSVF
jgi:hypothetical protein